MIITLVAALSAVSAAEVSPPPGATQLWYREPARVWTEALPVGNGSLGAMVFGGLAEERLQVNEDTLWTGRPHEYHRADAVDVLPELRQLLRDGRQEEAEELAMARFMGVPLRQEMYQPFCDIWLESPDHASAAGYRRELDLDRAIATVTYRVADTVFRRETFSSFPDRVLVHRVSADTPGKVAFVLRVTSPHEDAKVAATDANGLLLTSRVRGNGTRFAALIHVQTEGGRVVVRDGRLHVENADAATVRVSAATAFVSFQNVSADPVKRVRASGDRAEAKSFAALREAHVTDHQALFRRVTLDLGATEAADRPTNERLAAGGKLADPALVSLLFNYGRYLLIASSRPGSQAANLQGIWNDELNPPWGSKYTTNINFEMNYWPAEVGNLAECAEPMFDLIDDVVSSGRKTARGHYGARGWVLHHNTDIWRGTAPINASNHGIWPTGGAWLCLHLWERYRFTGDAEFLARRAYPVMKEAALFFVDTLVEDERTGWLISGPSNSPEQGGLVMGPTMDHQIIRGLFEWTATAARILNVDTELAGELDSLRRRIAPNQIGRLGQLQEWLEDKDDPNNRHRHVSHLWGVFPGEDITWATPDLMRAARQSLLYRGDGGTGWALGWKIALWARFRDGDHAHRILMNLLRMVEELPGQPRTKGGGGVYPNLFDAHPPFQIDGNFAATAGICEMLVQSHAPAPDAALGPTARAFTVELLPALPTVWPNGAITGVRARGGLLLDFSWRDGALERVRVLAPTGGAGRLRYRDLETDVSLGAGESATYNGGLEGVQAEQ